MSLIRAADTAQALLLEAISELTQSFEYSSDELSDQVSDLAGELEAMHGQVETLYTLACEEAIEDGQVI